MSTQMKEHTNNTSKYVSSKRDIQMLHKVAVFYIFSLFVLPQYFGFETPFFDFTMLRIGIVVLLLAILSETQLKKAFIEIIQNSIYFLPIVFYLVVVTYTMVFRKDLNAFLNPFIEILSLYLFIFCIKEALGFEKTYNLISAYVKLLLILGILEYVMGKTPFAYLETISGIYGGAFVRSGNYRIMSSAIHALGYGLMLVTFPPFICYNKEKKCIDLFAQPVFTILWVLNVLLTGSRSSLAVVGLEMVIMIVLMKRDEKRKTFFIGVLLIIALTAYLIPFHNTKFGNYMMLQITSIVDEIFNTNLSVKYGADLVALSSSSSYRKQLLGVYTGSWLNPILGIGRSRSFQGVVNGATIISIDDFYVAEFVRYAYPGLLSMVIFLFIGLINTIKKAFRWKNNLAWLLALSIGCYMLSIRWVDSLQTLKYLYVLFAFAECLENNEEVIEVKKVNSKYIRETRAQ